MTFGAELPRAAAGNCMFKNPSRKEGQSLYSLGQRTFILYCTGQRPTDSTPVVLLGGSA